MQLKRTGVLLAAAAAAFGAYKLYKMTPEQRNSLKTKGKNLLKRNNVSINHLGRKKNTPVASFAY